MDGARNGRIETTRLAGIYMMLGGMLALVLAGFGVTGAGATKPNPEHKVTLCHRTASHSNPYVEITPDVASVLHHGHDGHNGPIFFPGIPKHEKWGDIIPPFDFGPGEQYAGKNWPEGEAILHAGCTVPSATTTSGATTTTSGATTTTSGATTTSGETTTSAATTTTGETTTSGETSTSGGATTTQATTTSESPPVSVSSLGSSTTSTSVVATSTGATSTRPTGSGNSMPFTGSSVLPLVGVGLALIASGLGLVVRKRRLST